MQQKEENPIIRKPRTKRWVLWVQIIIIVYCSIGIALYYLQDRFLFHPVKLPSTHQFSFDVPFKEISIPFNEEDTLSMVQFFPKDSIRKGIVIYFHGNMGNIQRYARFTHLFTSKGYEVWMPDYPGFGKTTGERTEEKLYSQAYQVKRLAEKKYAADSIIVYGKSFGTGLAAYVASTGNQRSLILETPYYSIPDLFGRYAFMYPTSYMAHYKIPAGKYLQDVRSPIVAFHGTEDEVIPLACAEKLKRAFKQTDRFMTIKDGKHNNIPDSKIYQQVMDSLLR